MLLSGDECLVKFHDDAGLLAVHVAANNVGVVHRHEAVLGDEAFGFADVTPDMTIAREEIFGPVLSMIPYDSEADAIAIANGTDYGLAAYVQSADIERARKVGRALRAGGVHLNYPPADFQAPFGGYKRSGNGREWGEAGLREYLETKAMVGYGD